MSDSIIEVRSLRREFGKLTAVDDISFEVGRSIGLVFQQTTLDEYLTAEQNLLFHAYAYAVPADVRGPRIRELLTMVELWDRKGGSVRTFSGGMKRRLEIARGLLHHPKVLFLDEPTIGLDPQTRRHIWDYLLRLREAEDLTIFLTTQYLDEAEFANRIAIIDRGSIVALDTPNGLKSSIGGDLITFSTPDTEAGIAAVRERYGIEAAERDGSIRFHVAKGDSFLPEFVRSFPQPIETISLSRPSLDDVFLTLTGHEIRDAELDSKQQLLAHAGRWGR